MAVVMAAASCTDTAGWDIPLAQFHDMTRASFCRVRVLCGDFPDQSSCETYWSEVPHLYASLPRLVSSGRVAYDGSKARSCLEILDGATSCSRQLLNNPDAITVCDDVLVGKVPPGGDCFFNVECAPGETCQMASATCDPYAACCSGTCVGGPPLAAGDDCSSGQGLCGAGTACKASADGSTATCATLVTTLGGSCAINPCAGSLYCAPGSQVCLPPAQTGQPCKPELFGRDCDDLDDYCDWGTALCTVAGAVGSRCDPVFFPCVSAAYCDTTQTVCVALPTVGQPCAPGSGACLGSQACDLGSYTCVATSPGDSCL
jgi:hypothetical protein